MACIRYSMDAMVCIVQDDDDTMRVATQHDMETLEVGEDLSEEELAALEE